MSTFYSTWLCKTPLSFWDTSPLYAALLANSPPNGLLFIFPHSACLFISPHPSPIIRPKVLLWAIYSFYTIPSNILASTNTLPPDSILISSQLFLPLESCFRNTYESSLFLKFNSLKKYCSFTKKVLGISSWAKYFTQSHLILTTL